MGSLALLQLNIADRQLLHVREHLLHASLDVGNVIIGSHSYLRDPNRGHPQELSRFRRARSGNARRSLEDQEEGRA